MKNPNVFTTGRIAKALGASIATVQKWIDSGELESYRLPAMPGDTVPKERRVTRKALAAFCEKWSIPKELIPGQNGTEKP